MRQALPSAAWTRGSSWPRARTTGSMLSSAATRWRPPSHPCWCPVRVIDHGGCTCRYGDAFVAARPLNRGDRITRAMVTTQRVQVNSVRQGTITRLDNLVGLEMKRSVRAGTPFTPHLVITPDAVARGDHVMITARNQGFAVSTRGKALANARIGEQVLVENLSSSRTLRARVVAPGQVEVAM